MHPALETASTELAVGLPGLAKASDFSQDQIDQARDFFKERLAHGDPIDIVVCGSMARQEMSGASDFDYLVVAHGLVESATKFRAFRRACQDWCDERAMSRPGASGLFATVVSATELVERIGLEFDTNHSLTRRIILLEEGVSVLDPELHRRFVKVAIGRYLDGEHLDEHGVPRFLMNDICRYWRTIAVDYQAKVWQRLDGAGWGLRYLKLRMSRKLTFAASVIPLFLVALRKPDDAREFLTEQFVDLPPLARIAQLVEDTNEDSDARRLLTSILAAANDFVDFISDSDSRGEIARIETPKQAQKNEQFMSMQQLSADMQRDLENLFLDAPTLRTLGRKYLTF